MDQDADHKVNRDLTESTMVRSSVDLDLDHDTHHDRGMTPIMIIPTPDNLN